MTKTEREKNGFFFPIFEHVLIVEYPLMIVFKCIIAFFIHNCKTI